MKPLIYILLCLFLYACNEDPFESADTGQQTISIHINKPETRALNDTLTATWEKKINTATLYVFNPAGNAIYVYPLTTTQITALNNQYSTAINLLVPGNLTSCDIYMVANSTPSAPVTTKASLLSSIETDINSYNGTYAQVTTAAQRSNGFTMTASQNGIALSGSPAVNLTLKRIVAKVSLQITFSTLLQLGTITMNNVTLTQSAPVSNLFPLSTPNTTGNAITFSQVPNQPTSGVYIYQALFYIYENSSRTSNKNYVILSFSGTNKLLALLPTSFSYQIALTGDASGAISRNKVYFIKATVLQLTNLSLFSISGKDIAVTIEEKYEQ